MGGPSRQLEYATGAMKNSGFAGEGSPPALFGFYTNGERETKCLSVTQDFIDRLQDRINGRPIPHYGLRRCRRVDPRCQAVGEVQTSEVASLEEVSKGPPG